jgi:hypothetical protein
VPVTPSLHDHKELIFALRRIRRFVVNLFLSRCQKLVTDDVHFVL